MRQAERPDVAQGMTTMAFTKRAGRYAGACAAWIVFAIPGVAAQPADSPSTFEINGEVVLDNPRVIVEKYVLEPGQTTGRQRHRLDQLWVFVKGGVLTSADGRAVLWRDGRVLWRRASEAAETGSTNTGAAPMIIVCVNLKPWRPTTSPGKPKYRYLNYPNIPGEDVMENDLVIVQRFTVNPGQWEGVHAHHPDMLYIHIKGGEWAAKTYTESEHPYPSPAADGDVGWMPTIDLSVGHQSGNIGNAPIDLIWVTLKK
jgi:mannose-6-phosphate isomerase-like protein (cupin superfamily)